MEWTIPVQTFDPSNVVVGDIQKSHKPMAPLSYKDGELWFQSLSILFPPLTVKSYDPDTGRLAISLQGHSSLATKLQALQTAMLGATVANYSTWFPTERARGYEELASSFQNLVGHGCLYLYCPLVTTGSMNEIHIHSEGGWTRGVMPTGALAAGKQIRVAVRFQGISFHQHPISNVWTGKSRVQHRILAIYC
jgi:hypothetical protein